MVKLIVDIINHIEDNLEKDISVKSVSFFSGYSPHHFQKMFAACVGMSLGTYIRRRRLTKSAKRLASSKNRIIEIAQDAGFDSQEAFTRAFKSMFETTPKEYRVQRLSPGLRTQPLMSDSYVHHLRYEGVKMEPRFEEKNGFCVVGLGDKFKRGKTEDIGRCLWPEFIQRLDEIKHKKGKDKERFITYGICQEIWIKGHIQDTFRYFAAIEVEPNTKPPQGMELIKIEKQKYAIFTHRGGIKNLDHTNQYIWGTWLPQSGYELAPASDIEVYPGDFQPPHNDVPIEIWVPLSGVNNLWIGS